MKLQQHFWCVLSRHVSWRRHRFENALAASNRRCARAPARSAGSHNPVRVSYVSHHWPLAMVVCLYRMLRIGVSAWRIHCKHARWRHIMADGVLEARARRLCHDRLQRSVIRAFHCARHAQLRQQKRSYEHWRSRSLLQVSLPADICLPVLLSDRPLPIKTSFVSQVANRWRQHTAMMAAASNSLLTQHVKNRTRCSWLSTLCAWQAAAVRLREDRAAATRQQHVWDRVSDWLAHLEQ